MESILSSPTSHRLAAIGVMVGGMILIDSAIPGAGLLFIAAVFIVMFIRSNASDLVVKLLQKITSLANSDTPRKAVR